MTELVSSKIEDKALLQSIDDVALNLMAAVLLLKSKQ